MRKPIFAGLIPAAILAVVLAAARAEEREVDFISKVECRGEHADYRVDVKNDMETPPDEIAPKNRIKPSDIGNWPAPRGVITKTTPRSGREKEWFAVTGRVVLVKAEADGDLHVQLVDLDGASKVNVVVEVPVKQHLGDSPWDAIRTTVFDWTKATFPFKVASDKTLEPKGQYPVIRVEGKAFFDAMHAKKVDGKLTNRRTETGKAEEVAVWEIHPVMELTVLEAP